jgi:hypothetical protein
MNTTCNDQQFAPLAASQLSEIVGGQAARHSVAAGGSASPSTAPSAVPSPIPPSSMDPTQQYSADTQQSSADPTQQYFQSAGTGKTCGGQHHHKRGKRDD